MGVGNGENEALFWKFVCPIETVFQNLVRQAIKNNLNKNWQTYKNHLKQSILRTFAIHRVRL